MLQRCPDFGFWVFLPKSELVSHPPVPACRDLVYRRETLSLHRTQNRPAVCALNVWLPLRLLPPQELYVLFQNGDSDSSASGWNGQAGLEEDGGSSSVWVGWSRAGVHLPGLGVGLPLAAGLGSAARRRHHSLGGHRGRQDPAAGEGGVSSGETVTIETVPSSPLFQGCILAGRAPWPAVLCLEKALLARFGCLESRHFP